MNGSVVLSVEWPRYFSCPGLRVQLLDLSDNSYCLSTKVDVLELKMLVRIETITLKWSLKLKTYAFNFKKR